MARDVRAGAPVEASGLMAISGARASVLLTSLDPRALEDLVDSAVFAGFAARDPISSRPAPDDALHILVRGAALEQTWASSTGTEYYARPLGVGAAIGLTDTLTTDSLPRETRALVPTLTVRIPGMAVRGLLATSPLVAQGFARACVDALRTSEADRVMLATGDAMTRVTQRVLELAANWGAPSDDGIEVDLPITQAQLGAWAGVSRESAVKCLQWLRGRNLVHTSRRHLMVLDLPELENLAGRRAGTRVAELMDR